MLFRSDDKERKAQMSVWMQKLKQKLSWLHAVKISIIRLTTLPLSCPIRKSHSYKYLPYNKRVSKPSFPHFKKSTTFVSVYGGNFEDDPTGQAYWESSDIWNPDGRSSDKNSFVPLSFGAGVKAWLSNSFGLGLQGEYLLPVQKGQIGRAHV